MAVSKNSKCPSSPSGKHRWQMTYGVVHKGGRVTNKKYTCARCGRSTK